MNVGPAGFAGAPLSKALVAATVACSVAVQTAARSAAAPRAPPLLARALRRALAFRSPGELLFGALLAYAFRTLERQLGTGRYAAFALAMSAVSRGLEAAAAAVLRRPAAAAAASAAASGPYALVFAAMALYALEAPPLHAFSLAGLPVSDKIFVYVCGAQLALAGGAAGAAAAAAGAAAGVLYRLNAFGARQWRLPRAVEAAAAATVGRLLAGAPAAAPPRGAARAARPAAAPPPPPPLPEADPGAVAQLVDMGFDAAQASDALRRAHNNVEQALPLLL
jgi:hypothetical protein